MARKIVLMVLGFLTSASVAVAMPASVGAPAQDQPATTSTSFLIQVQADWLDPISSTRFKHQVQADRLDPIPSIRFKHGDISWLPSLAKQAGWPNKTIPQLTQIVLRESGGCPNRRGGDMVDKNCNITGVSEWNHRSDTGLLQINGVHWKPDHAQYQGLICEQMAICSQEPLLDPLTNLKAGKLLWDVAGWSPWKIQIKPKKPTLPP